MRFLADASAPFALGLLVHLATFTFPAKGETPRVQNGQGEAAPVVRKFRFTYAGAVNGLTPGAAARVWLPLAQDAFGQKCAVVKLAIPAEYRTRRESQYGNRLLYFEATANEQGEIPFAVEYRVERRELVRGQEEPAREDDLAKHRAPVRPAPAGGFLGVLLGRGVRPPAASPILLAKELYARVDDRLRYDKPQGGGWGRGDALWVCQAGYGNCSDFHSLFLAAAREAGLPVRFEIGFPLPPQRGQGEILGYHCWAAFAANGTWIPVDISEADKHPELKDYYFGNLTADRVLFTVGRDLRLEPPQEAGPVNFLIYPYVEVEGRPHTALAPAFRFEDVP